MKKAILTAMLSAVVLSGTPTPGHAADTADNGVQVEQPAPDVQDFDKQMEQAQQYMAQMQEQMDNIRETQDPQMRQKLLQEHWATMQKNMQLMHGMWREEGGLACCMGGGKRGHGMMRGWRHMGGHYSKLTPEQLQQRQYMMDQYLPMQQRMMQHMMEHQHYMWAK